MKAIYIAMVLLAVFAAASFAAEEKLNCRLAVRTTFKGGKKKVEVMEVSADSREHCKSQARERETASRDEEVENVHVTFGYRELNSLKK